MRDVGASGEVGEAKCVVKFQRPSPGRWVTKRLSTTTPILFTQNETNTGSKLKTIDVHQTISSRSITNSNVE